MFRSLAVLRVARRAPASMRSIPAFVRPTLRMYSGEELSDADFDAKWRAYFADESLDGVQIRRGLNDVFAADLIPDPSILEQALRACRRVNDFPTTVRIFEGVRDKAPDDATYQYVVDQLKPVVEELHLSLPTELGLQK